MKNNCNKTKETKFSDVKESSVLRVGLGSKMYGTRNLCNKCIMTFTRCNDNKIGNVRT
jgi:hypothetical protein